MPPHVGLHAQGRRTGSGTLQTLANAELPFKFCVCDTWHIENGELLDWTARHRVGLVVLRRSSFRVSV